jgi:hypothetical protein
MRTTVSIEDHLLAEAKKVAARSGKSLAKVIEEALRESLARKKEFRKREPVRLVTFRGSGLQPGVDLDDSASVLELMDSNDSG